MSGPGTVKYWEQQHTAAINRAQIAEQANLTLRKAAKRAVDIIRRNNYHQAEKVEDARYILADALAATKPKEKE